MTLRSEGRSPSKPADCHVAPGTLAALCHGAKASLTCFKLSVASCLAWQSHLGAQEGDCGDQAGHSSKAEGLQGVEVPAPAGKLLLRETAGCCVHLASVPGYCNLSGRPQVHSLSGLRNAITSDSPQAHRVRHRKEALGQRPLLQR